MEQTLSDSDINIADRLEDVSLHKDQRHPSVSRPTRASIVDLPTELLLHIFELVYEEWNLDYHLPTSCCELPHVLATVCPRWLEVLLLLPQLWTHVVIFVDSDPTPLSSVRAFLEASKELTPIHVLVTRRDVESTPARISDTTERRRVHSVMQTILPHIHRIETMVFDVIHSSSLPRIGRDLFGDAPLMETLGLQCVNDDEVQSIEGIPHEFTTSELDELILDGRNFIDVCRLSSTGWFHTIQKITIAHLARPNNENFRLVCALDALTYCSQVKRITFHDVDMDYDRQRDAHSVVHHFPSLELLSLEDLSGHMLAGFHSITTNSSIMTSSGVQIAVKRCAMDNPALPTLCSLSLRGIGAEINLTETFMRWRGESLSFFDCPCLDDDLLKAMLICGKDDDGHPTPSCSQLKYVDIWNCENFTTGTLIALLKSRAAAESDKVKPLVVLTVCGRGPELLEEDAMWLKSNVRAFVWRTELPDGRKCWR
ncbi:hypothetical protein BV22DRAFT_1134654 [Leucogyrophana mollusca]|uniref:Uncharacterized protein n=1 Tax=Leucogyrophana mollusca TaxID=85980 RepID=A0ACB8AYL9_9AGAM|nr:hypothetical protein BV22DRAFT_1134654 [Leucogyrophana mollusca]